MNIPKDKFEALVRAGELLRSIADSAPEYDVIDKHLSCALVKAINPWDAALADICGTKEENDGN